MANDTATTQSSPVIALFQKAHGRIVMLQRVDEQLGGLLEQRRKIQDELRYVQAQINDEFERVMKQADEAPAKLLSQIAEHARGANGDVAAAASRLDIDEEAVA